jgi:hypothetical protein
MAGPSGEVRPGWLPLHWQGPQARSSYGTGDSNSTAPVSSIRGQGAVGRATCGFCERLVTTRARCCPWFPLRLRTQHGPTQGLIAAVGLGSLVPPPNGRRLGPLGVSTARHCRCDRPNAPWRSSPGRLPEGCRGPSRPLGLGQQPLAVEVGQDPAGVEHPVDGGAVVADPFQVGQDDLAEVGRWDLGKDLIDRGTDKHAPPGPAPR